MSSPTEQSYQKNTILTFRNVRAVKGQPKEVRPDQVWLYFPKVDNVDTDLNYLNNKHGVWVRFNKQQVQNVTYSTVMGPKKNQTARVTFAQFYPIVGNPVGKLSSQEYGQNATIALPDNYQYDQSLNRLWLPQLSVITSSPLGLDQGEEKTNGVDLTLARLFRGNAPRVNHYYSF
jgi:hypothetical protein